MPAVLRSLRVLPALALAACGAPAPTVAPPPVDPLPAASARASAPPPGPTVVAAPAAATPPMTPPEPPALAATFHRELEASVTALAVERPPFMAAATRDAVWMHEARGWHEEKLPPAARGAPIAVFYGRDDRVRVVGVGGPSSTTPGIYLRWKPDGFRAAPYELGKLAALPRPLVSVLGNDDPEIVCQPGDTCVVKRRTGWKFQESPADIALVTLGEGTGWGIAGQKLLRLDARDRWETVGPAGEWRTADALFATRDRAWVVETAAGRAHAFDGTRWQAAPSPIERPRALWGAKRDALWLAGDGGLAFFDGATWRRVGGAPAPLATVAGRSTGEVWVGGERGLFRVELAR